MSTTGKVSVKEIVTYAHDDIQSMPYSNGWLRVSVAY
jgi:hypothetical protein